MEGRRGRPGVRSAGRGCGGLTKETPIWWALIIGELLLAALVTLIFGRWASISTPLGGLKAGKTE